MPKPKDGVDGAGYGIGHSGDGHIEPRMGWVLRVKVVMKMLSDYEYDGAPHTGEDENDGDDAIHPGDDGDDGNGTRPHLSSLMTFGN